MPLIYLSSEEGEGGRGGEQRARGRAVGTRRFRHERFRHERFRHERFRHKKKKKKERKNRVEKKGDDLCRSLPPSFSSIFFRVFISFFIFFFALFTLILSYCV